MKLKKISLKNIRSYRDETIEFPPGSTLLSGDIGSGKTSILLAIEFALFGLQPGQKGSSLLRSDSSEGEVILEFEIGEDNFEIKRSLKRGSKSVSQGSGFLTVNEKKEELSITELKTKILTFLNYPQEFVKKTNILYRYTVYSPQEEMKQIILEDPESRLNVIRHIFGMDKYKRVKENIQIIALKLRERSRVLQGEVKDIDEYKTLVSQNNQRIKKIELDLRKKKEDFNLASENRKGFEKDLEKIESKFEERIRLEKEVEKAKIIESNKTVQLAESKKELEKIQNSLAKIIERFNFEDYQNLINEIEAKRLSIESLSQKYINSQAAINSLNIKISEDSRKRERIFRIDICPTCLQNVSENHKHNITNDTEVTITKAEKEISSLKEQIDSLTNNLENEKNSLKEFEAKKSYLEILKSKEESYEASQKRLDELTKQISSLNTDLEVLASHSSLLRDSIFNLRKFENIYIATESKLKDAFRKERDIEIEIAEINKEVELVQRENKRITDKIKQKQDLADQLSTILEAESWISEDFLNLISFIERNIMFKLRQEFSKLFNKWFEMLTTDNFNVQIDETFSPIIMQGDYELDYSFLSGGERTAVALAYRLALNQTINSVFSHIRTRSLVILDEPTDGFSDQQLTKVRDVLQELDTEQLIMVSHEPKIESFVDNVIRLRKSQGASAVLSEATPEKSVN